jgi:hypothetical protein
MRLPLLASLTVLFSYRRKHRPRPGERLPMRLGIKFQNGEQFDAEAGENTLERHLSGRVTGFTLLANGVLRLQDVRPKQ